MRIQHQATVSNPMVQIQSKFPKIMEKACVFPADGSVGILSIPRDSL